MLRTINIIEMIVSILLVISILLQNRGAGLSQAFGGDMGGYYTKRGFERFLVYFSVALSAIFIILAVVILTMAKNNA